MSPVLTKIMVSNALMGSLNGDLLHILFIFEEAATVIEPDWASTPELILLSEIRRYRKFL